MLLKHKSSVVLLIVAIAWYAFFGVIGPDLLYPNPQTQAEVAADVVTVVTALLRVSAPWIAAVIAVLTATLFLRERRR